MSPSVSPERDSDNHDSQLDKALVAAIREHGWPVWHTSGDGGFLPGTPECDFAYTKWQWCARVDSFRGEKRMTKETRLGNICLTAFVATVKL